MLWLYCALYFGLQLSRLFTMSNVVVMIYDRSTMHNKNAPCMEACYNFVKKEEDKDTIGLPGSYQWCICYIKSIDDVYNIRYYLCYMLLNSRSCDLYNYLLDSLVYSIFRLISKLVLPAQSIYDTSDVFHLFNGTLSFFNPSIVLKRHAISL